MRFLIVLTAVILAANAANLSATKFSSFKNAFKKTYPTKAEENLRAVIFENNLKKIEEHNKRYEAGLESYNMAVNQFADMTHEEFVKFLKAQGSKPVSKKGVSVFKSVTDDIPEAVDWREKEAVTGVKDQGFCGSCWAFSASGALESLYFLKSGELLVLTEQQLVDCSRDYGNEGCNGGWMDSAYDYVKDNGIATEEQYPYKGFDGQCYAGKVNLTDIKVLGHTQIAASNETDLKLAVATVGPIGVAVDATWLQFYMSGIFDNTWCGNDENSLNHGVLVVGLGVEEEQEYWIIKNSWGKSWGEKGYFRLARNADNLCGVATAASYPNL